MEYRGKCLEMPHSDQTIQGLFTVRAYSLDGHSMLNIKRMVNVNVEMKLPQETLTSLNLVNIFKTTNQLMKLSMVFVLITYFYF